MALPSCKTLLLLLVLGIIVRTEADAIDDLVNTAAEAGALFTQVSLARLDAGQWGAKRAARTTDAIIMNTSRVSFQLASKTCASGSYSTGLLPESQLGATTSTVFGIQSSTAGQGVRCTTKYESSEGSFITMLIDNPFNGDNAVNVDRSWDLAIVPTLSHGQNNQVTFIVSQIA